MKRASKNKAKWNHGEDYTQKIYKKVKIFAYGKLSLG
jgi:hypothetical protein